ncbi:helix-turn-helix domain-containing protein [Streptomyces sp. NPDC058595]|uniref:AlbA family DNA-binding domain-containing protein n=1 Tax=Streptomyces sp. NPDC058595 TaxID=3346550 RepID=UPI00364D0137
MEEREISRKDALEIINKQESHFWDFKSASSSGRNIQEIASALANAEGGDFIIGIEDEKHASGILNTCGSKTWKELALAVW